MKKRTKQSSRYWNAKLTKMFKDIPESKDVEYRYRALRYLLIHQYPELEKMSKETLLVILKDCVYLDRQIRLLTEGLQSELKTELSQEKVLEMYGYQQGNLV